MVQFTTCMTAKMGLMEAALRDRQSVLRSERVESSR